MNINNDLLVYPNPAMDEIVVDIPGNRNEKTVIAILNIAGKNIRTVQKNLSNGKTTLDISFLQNGVYIMRVESAGRLLFGKIIKQ
jgi:hypothetical protein